MPHSCPRCDFLVEDSRPFCSGCGAAQVHFSASKRVGEAVLVTSSIDRGPGDRGPGLPDAVSSIGDTYVKGGSHPALRAAAYAGVIGALLCLVPLRPIFVLAMPFGGFLSVFFYRRFTQGILPLSRAGFKLGAMAGLFSFVLLLVSVALGTLAPHSQNELRDALLQSFQQVQEQTTDPQARQMLDYFVSSRGMAVVIVAGFVLMAVIFVLLSGIGGAVSASFLGRKSPPQQ